MTRSMPGKKRKSEEAEAKQTKKAKPEKKNKSDTKWEEVEWVSEAKTEEGHKWTLELSSCNVDGERSTDPSEARNNDQPIRDAYFRSESLL